MNAASITSTPAITVRVLKTKNTCQLGIDDCEFRDADNRPVSFCINCGRPVPSVGN